jgi:transposase
MEKTQSKEEHPMKPVKDIAKRTVRYIGMDVHRDSTTVAVLDAQGNLLMQVTLRTEGNILVDFLSGLRGTLHLTFEEGTYSAWLYTLLSPSVEKLMVCNPRQNALLKHGNKSDSIDARKLAELLRLGSLTAVYHGSPGMRTLKELAASYGTLVRDGTRVMNRLKGLYRGRGIRCGGMQVYSPRHRDRWLQQLHEPGARQRAELLYQELDLLLQLRPQARRALLGESRKQAAQKILRTIPGLGPVRVALLLAWLQTPHRFRNKRKLWGYGGLGLITRGSSQYQLQQGELVVSPKGVRVRGLNPAHNPVLKDIFKGAALVACQRPGPLREAYARCLAQGTAEHLARLTIARKIATLVLTLWKKGERFDAKRLRREQAA